MDKHIHGGELAAFAGQFGVKEGDIIDFSSNINPLPLPEEIAVLYRNLFREIARYPEPYAENLCAQIAKNLGLPPRRIVAGNGSTALLGFILRALQPRKALLVEPCFSEYRHSLEREGVLIRTVHLDPKRDFRFDLDQIRYRMQDADILILGYPNNPTGTALNCEEVLELLPFVALQNKHLILDEAFIDWVPEMSLATNISGSAPVTLLKSLTKFYGMAGLRSAFAVGPVSLIEKVKDLQGPWAANHVAPRLSEHLIQDTLFQGRSRKWLREEKVWMEEAVRNAGSYRVIPSHANFMLVQMPGSARELFEVLGRQGIYIRRVDDFQGLDDSYFRIAIRMRDDNEKLIRALSLFRAGKPARRTVAL